MKNNLFYCDLSSNVEISYDKLKDDLVNIKSFNTCIDEQDYYSIFKKIILSLLLDKSIYLIDSEFSVLNKKQIINKYNKSISVKDIDISSLNNLKIKKWSITLFSSGTTGNPKQVSHNFDTITRSVRKSEKHNNDIWGYAYNPTHIAGLQVFFQSVLNFNQIIRLFDLPIDIIHQSIEKYKISHISATPTFYRLLCFNEKPMSSVLKATSGGEMLNENTKEKISLIFPNADILNIYASTEAGTVIYSKKNYFEVKDVFNNFVKIEDNELKLHKSILGEFKEKKIINDWYSTGDLVEIICHNPLRFKFSSRKSDIVNIGGYMVNTKEVETLISDIKGINDVLVYSKKNSLIGNILFADIVLYKKNELDESKLKKYLRKLLPKHKIPAKFNFLNNIKSTRTGKKAYNEK